MRLVRLINPPSAACGFDLAIMIALQVRPIAVRIQSLREWIVAERMMGSVSNCTKTANALRAPLFVTRMAISLRSVRPQTKGPNLASIIRHDIAHQFSEMVRQCR